MTTATRLPARVLATIRRHGLLDGGEAVLAAVSGGADSVALLDVLVALRARLALTVAAVYVDHGLRPEAADEARLVEGLCARLAVPFHLERVRLPSGPPWEGLEAEARRARYRALSRLAVALGAARIATGHTADDQAETVLMRLLAGAGPRGLAGIRPVRGRLIRPLLECRRAEIEAHLGARGLDWAEDRTNRDPRFLRNRIRHEVLPFLGRAYDPGIVDALCRSAALVRGLVADLEHRAAAELDRIGRPAGSGFVFSAADLERLPGEVAAEMLRLAVDRAGEGGPLRGAVQRDLRALLAPGAGTRRVRVRRVTVERSGRWLRVAADLPASLPPRPWTVPGALLLPEVGACLEARCFERDPGYQPPRHPDAAAFDADRVPGSLVVRGRRPGDRFRPFGGAGVRRLKSVLIDAGVPAWDRARVPLVEGAGEILWVAGVRRADTAPVGPGTTRILELTFRTPLAAAPAAG